MTEAARAHHEIDFSLVQGGPYYRLLLRGKLLRAPMALVRRRVLVCIASGSRPWSRCPSSHSR